jgi:hypothetical protein
MQVFQRQLSNYDETRPCGSNKRGMNRYTRTELKSLMLESHIKVPVSASIDVMCNALRDSKIKQNVENNQLNRILRGQDAIVGRITITEVLDEENFYLQNYEIAEKLLPVPEELRCFQSLHSRTFDLTISNTIDLFADQHALLNYRSYVDKLIKKLVPFGKEILHPPLLQKLYLRLLVSTMILYHTKYEFLRPTLTDTFISQICEECQAMNIKKILERSELYVERLYRRIENMYSTVDQNFLVDLYSGKETKLGNRTVTFEDLILHPYKNIYILLPLPYNLVQLFSATEQEQLIATSEMFARVNLADSCKANVKKLFKSFKKEEYNIRIWASSILLQQEKTQKKIEEVLKNHITPYVDEVKIAKERITKKQQQDSSDLPPDNFVPTPLPLEDLNAPPFIPQPEDLLFTPQTTKDFPEDILLSAPPKVLSAPPFIPQPEDLLFTPQTTKDFPEDILLSAPP